MLRSDVFDPSLSSLSLTRPDGLPSLAEDDTEHSRSQLLPLGIEAGSRGRETKP